MIQIQATISGYAGKPATVFSVYDPETLILVLAAEAEFRTDRREGCAMVITNDARLDRDRLFRADDLPGAIRAYFDLKGGLAADGRSPRLVFSERAQRASPEHAIERDGMDANGPKYRVSESMTCAQVAVLATCAYARIAATGERAVQFTDTLQTLLSGGVVTV